MLAKLSYFPVRVILTSWHPQTYSCTPLKSLLQLFYGLLQRTRFWTRGWVFSFCCLFIFTWFFIFEIKKIPLLEWFWFFKISEIDCWTFSKILQPGKPSLCLLRFWKKLETRRKHNAWKNVTLAKSFVIPTCFHTFFLQKHPKIFNVPHTYVDIYRQLLMSVLGFCKIYMSK